METTHGRMIGQDFFDLRSHLGSTLSELARFAPEAGADPDHSVILESLVNNLKEPFVFVVVGEVNVGKSTFLNALFASDITKTGVVPTTDKILFFKHGPALKHVSITRTLEEVFVPIEFLRDFHIVDTPGTNSIENEHQEITERFVPMADLVIFVFSAMNPWGASTWEFLEKVHRHWMRHVIFVLQQCDLRAPEEIAAILEYMKQLCRQRFQKEFPIFPVSAKRAFLARSGGLDRDRLMKESGFLPLESHISRVIGGSGQRLGKLATALRTGAQVLGALQERSGARAAARQDKLRALQEIEEELRGIEARTRTKLNAVIEATETDVERESSAILARVRSRLGMKAALTSVWREKRSAEGLESSLTDQVRAACLERWSLAAVIIEDDVNAAGEYLGERIKEDLKVQLRDELRPDAKLWKVQRQRFVNRVDEMLRGGIQTLELESELRSTLRASRRFATAFLIGVMMLIAGAVLAAGEIWVPAAILGGAGLVMALLCWLKASSILQVSKEVIAEKLAGLRPIIREHLENHLQGEVHDLYSNFTRILKPTRDRFEEQTQRQSATQAQITSIGNAFQAMEAQLGSLVASALL